MRNCRIGIIIKTPKGEFKHVDYLQAKLFFSLVNGIQ